MFAMPETRDVRCKAIIVHQLLQRQEATFGADGKHDREQAVEVVIEIETLHLFLARYQPEACAPAHLVASTAFVHFPFSVCERWRPTHHFGNAIRLQSV